MTYSMNNRLILEHYVPKSLESTRMGGIATPGQRNKLVGLKVLVDAHLGDGKVIPSGSLALT